MMKKLGVLLGGIVIGISLGSVDTVHATEQANRTQAQNPANTYQQLNLFGNVFERVRAEYVEEVEDEELIQTALNGMLSALDPHSAYLSEEELKDMRVQTKGEFGGLGIEVTMENGLVKVVSPIDDTPAFRAGMQSGDLIVTIDGEPVTGLSLTEAVRKMRGKVGTKIQLEVAREGEPDLIDVEIIRDVIQLRSVRHRVESDNVGYIRITTFSSKKTYDGVKKAIREINKEAGDELIGYVLDLRNNPGGLLDQAIAISDAFLDQGEIVSTRGRNKDDIRRDNATKGDLAEGLPIVVLVNGGSASASEIVAGALQDHKRALILGTQTFGKGSVQTILPISGNGAMRLTTARYYTPSGTSIQAKGITPDIVVERVAVTGQADRSGRLSEADLRGALDKDRKDGRKDSKKDEKDEGEEEIVDYQLTRAVDLLEGITLYKGALKE